MTTKINYEKAIAHANELCGVNEVELMCCFGMAETNKNGQEVVRSVAPRILKTEKARGNALAEQEIAERVEEMSEITAAFGKRPDGSLNTDVLEANNMSITDMLDEPKYEHLSSRKPNFDVFFKNRA